MSVSPEKNSEGLVTFSIYSDESKINDSFEAVSIWVRKEVNRIGRATSVSYTHLDVYKRQLL